MSFNVVIPARLNSSRLEEKVLIEINGIPMVIHVAQRASLSGAKNVVIATDDEKIKYSTPDAYSRPRVITLCVSSLYACHHSMRVITHITGTRISCLDIFS